MEVKKVMERLNQVLEDDATPFGGVARQGETLGEFLEEVGIPKCADLPTVNKALKECGIRVLS